MMKRKMKLQQIQAGLVSKRLRVHHHHRNESPSWDEPCEEEKKLKNVHELLKL
jgi:hypothetical protein